MLFSSQCQKVPSLNFKLCRKSQLKKQKRKQNKKKNKSKNWIIFKFLWFFFFNNRENGLIPNKTEEEEDDGEDSDLPEIDMEPSTEEEIQQVEVSSSIEKLAAEKGEEAEEQEEDSVQIIEDEEEAVIFVETESSVGERETNVDNQSLTDGKVFNNTRCLRKKCDVMDYQYFQNNNT